MLCEREQWVVDGDLFSRRPQLPRAGKEGRLRVYFFFFRWHT